MGSCLVLIHPAKGMDVVRNHQFGARFQWFSLPGAGQERWLDGPAEFGHCPQKAQTDAEFYSVQKQAEANRLLLTPEFLDLKKVEAMSTNNKVNICLIFFAI